MQQESVYGKHCPNGSSGISPGMKVRRRRTRLARKVLVCTLFGVPSFVDGLCFCPSAGSTCLMQRQKFSRVQSQLLYGASSSVSSPLLFHHRTDTGETERRSLESSCVARIRKCSDLDSLELAVKESQVSSKDASSEDNGLVERITPNVAAAALRKLTQLSSQSRRIKNIGNPVDENFAALKKALFECLLEKLSTPEEGCSLTIYALVDALYSLAYFRLEDEAKIRKLAQVLLFAMEEKMEKVLHSLRPTRFVDILQSLHALGLVRIAENSFNTEQYPSVNKIQKQIFQKLSQGNVLAQLSPGDMSILLNIMAFIPQPLSSEEVTLAVALMRRFRKQEVRQISKVRPLYRALKSCSLIAAQAKEISISDRDECDKLHKEAKIMSYTVFKEILQKQTNSSSDDQEEHVMTLQQISDALDFLSSLGVWTRQQDASEEPEDPVVQSLWTRFLLGKYEILFNKVSIKDLSGFFRVIERLQCNTVRLPTETVQLLGEKLLVHARSLAKGDALSPSDLDPKIVNALLRCATHMHGNNATVMQPFLETSDCLLTSHEFLSQCQTHDLTNFLAFLEKTKFFRKQGNEQGIQDDTLLAVGYRILDDDVAACCTPSQASRILSSFTSVVVERNRYRDESESSTVRENRLLADLFHVLGEHLLTSSPEQLSIRDISSALCAYAKFSYLQDMGIFDHLACLIADRMEECTVRQVTQSLWACGKMAVWEQQGERGETSNSQAHEIDAPPYMPSAEEFARFLSHRSDEMSAKDVAQTIWALGRLQNLLEKHKEEVHTALGRFVSRAMSLISKLTSQEIANIMWGLGRVGFEDTRIVHSFTNRLIYLSQSSVSNKPSPQEAANVMYALARMNIQDREVFAVLSNNMLDQLEVASAQAVANALWAHRAVQITPPQKLLDDWAAQKLGLVSIQCQLKP